MKSSRQKNKTKKYLEYIKLYLSKFRNLDKEAFLRYKKLFIGFFIITAKKELLSFWNAPKDYLKDIIAKLRLFISRIDTNIQKLMLNSNNKFKLLLSAFTICFLGICLLSSYNPFRLISPEFSFYIPKKDDLSLLRLYAVTKNAEVILIEHAFQKNMNLDLRITLLASVITNPLQSKIKSETIHTTLGALPSFANAIRQIWQVNEKYIIINFSENALNYEEGLFKKESEDSKNKTHYLNSFFRAFSRNVFLLEPQLDTIEFWLDNKSSHLPNLEFDLRQKISRNTLLLK